MVLVPGIGIAIHREPRAADTYAMLEAFRGGLFVEAERRALALTKSHPDFALGWKVLGVSLRQNGKYREALAAALKATRVFEGVSNWIAATPQLRQFRDIHRDPRRLFPRHQTSRRSPAGLVLAMHQIRANQCGWLGGSKDIVLFGAPLASLAG